VSEATSTSVTVAIIATEIPAAIRPYSDGGGACFVFEEPIKHVTHAQPLIVRGCRSRRDEISAILCACIKLHMKIVTEGRLKRASFVLDGNARF
jgi:hypothetical protein